MRQLIREAGGQFHLAFGLAKVVRPFRCVGQVHRPFPIAVTLADDDFLLQLGVVSVVGRFEIQREADGIIHRVQHEVAVLQRDASPMILGGNIAGFRVAEIFIAVVDVKPRRVAVGETMLDLGAKFPALIIFLADRRVADEPRRDVLLDFPIALRLGLRLVGVGEQFVVGDSGGGEQRGGRDDGEPIYILHAR